MPTKRTDMVFKDTGLPEPWRRVGDQWQLHVFALPVPTKTYWADAVVVKRVFGVPTLFFAQVLDEDKPPHTYYAVTLPPSQLESVAMSFDNIRQMLAQRFSGGGHRDFAQLDLSGVAESRRVKHAATVVRAVVNAEHAMLDFYLVELVTEDIMKARGIKMPPVHANARVWMTPELLLDLVVQLHAIRG